MSGEEGRLAAEVMISQKQFFYHQDCRLSYACMCTVVLLCIDFQPQLHTCRGCVSVLTQALQWSVAN